MSATAGARGPSAGACPCCEAPGLERVHVYPERPEGETPFDLADPGGYLREIWRCPRCGHFVSRHEMELGRFYEGEYVDATYGGDDGIHRSYERIMNLDPAHSDNVGRVARVIELAAKHLRREAPLRVLDVGAGLGVFLGRLCAHTDWECTAWEADPRLAKHMRDVLGIAVIVGDHATARPGTSFDLITSNKVLEHVEAPLEMLVRFQRDLAPGGAVYLELPDGAGAAGEGFQREEFFIEHHHVFSLASLEALCHKAGFRVLWRERLREPSSKYTLRAFLDVDPEATPRMAAIPAGDGPAVS